MSEVDFFQNFLAVLEPRPLQMPADFVADARQYSARPPPFLARMPQAMSSLVSADASTTDPSSGPAATDASAPSAEPTCTVHLQSLRNPKFSLTLDRLPVRTTAIVDLKQALQQRQPAADSGVYVTVPNIKILFQKKPVPDSKTLQELVESANHETELSLTVMVVGGGSPTPPPGYTASLAQTSSATPTAPTVEKQPSPQASSDAPTTSNPAGQHVLDTPMFWKELEGFVSARVTDPSETRAILQTWKAAWSQQHPSS